MKKKLWVGLLVLIFFMVPALVGAATCYDQHGLPILNEEDEPDCPEWVVIPDYGTSTSPIVGTWNWFNGKVYDINNDKNIYEGATDVGGWVSGWPTATSADKYTLTWNFGGYIDYVTLSNDGNTLSGTNNTGMSVWATRVPDSNTSTCQATLASDLSIHIPYLESKLPMVNVQYFEMDLALVSNPFFGYTTTGLYFEMTGFSTVGTKTCTPAELKTATGLDYVDNPDLLAGANSLVIRIPNVLLWDGETLGMLELFYDTLYSSEEHAYFFISLYAFDD